MLKNSPLLLNSVRFIVLVLVQVMLCNHINFYGFINPYIYLIFILLLPFTGNRAIILISSFFIGLTIDFFSDSGGIHAAASVLIAYLRPAFLKFSFGVSYEHNNIKLSKTNIAERISYILLMVFTHHLVLFSLEYFSVEHILLILKSTLFTSVFSSLLIFCIVIIFQRT